MEQLIQNIIEYPIPATYIIVGIIITLIYGTKAIGLGLTLDDIGDTVQDIFCGFWMGLIVGVCWPAIVGLWTGTYLLMRIRMLVRGKKEQFPFWPIWKLFWPPWKEIAPSTEKTSPRKIEVDELGEEYL